MGIRLVIILILLVVVYYLGKRAYHLFVGLGQSTSKPTEIKAGVNLTQDPVCLTYVSTEEAISTHQDGKTHYFCSQSCADKFSNPQT